jgi:hypothetical protein
MDNLTIRLHWRGPYLVEEVCDPELERGNGLYLISGRRKYERAEQIQYCGITEGLYRNRFKQHHKLPEVVKDCRIWLGEVAYPQEFTRTHLETAESMIVYFWKPNLNEHKKFVPPRPTALISHWFKKDGSPRYNQLSIYDSLHDVLCWDGELWRSGNLKVWSE